MDWRSPDIAVIPIFSVQYSKITHRYYAYTPNNREENRVKIAVGK
jgi:hypothetical protein